MPEIYGFRVGSTTYEYDYEHLANKPEEIPEFDHFSDSGKVLAVSSHGGMEWVRIPALPDTENESPGKVLMVVSDSGNVPRWEYLIPSYSYSDDGKALVVNGCSERLEWKRIPPEPEGGDNGKVLVCCGTSGGMEWANILPDVIEAGMALVSGDSAGVYEWERILPEWDGNDDRGKVLSIDSHGELAWLPGSTLPQYSQGDSGKVLTVNSNGVLEWMPVGST